VTILRVGTNQKYSDGWEAAFSGRKGGKATAKKKPAKKSPKKSKK
jgi:hypothetical protein